MAVPSLASVWWSGCPLFQLESSSVCLCYTQSACPMVISRHVVTCLPVYHWFVCVVDILVIWCSPGWPSGLGIRLDIGSVPACAVGFFFWSSHTSDVKIGTPVTTMPGAWCYSISAGTGWPSISVLWVSEIDSLMYNFCLSVTAHKLVLEDPSLRCTSMLLGC